MGVRYQRRSRLVRPVSDDPGWAVFITNNGWTFSLMGLAAITATIAPLGWYFAKLGDEGKRPIVASNVRQASACEALRTAFGDRS